MGDESFDIFKDQKASLFPTPRPFQDKAHEMLRDGYKHGHKNQLICAPTGAGKTVLSLRIINEALKKNKRAVFICDRKTLINQTSETADRYGMDHGIIQADHWRRKPESNFQIASIQTLMRRKWPGFDVAVVDECHVQMKSWVDFAMDKSIKTAVIGLTATPFSKGLGKIFTNAIMAATMHELTQQGILVPMRVFSCTKPDMSGAETLGGEWTDKAAEERELKIVGDVVTEWVKFGENRKTIIFGSTIAHCEEMCRQFNEAGICAAVYTSHTSDDERAEILDEYKQFDSPLKILISVEALARGFDVPAVSCLGDARPLRKSFSTVIQMWGRALRASPETLKTDAIMLDFSGNIHRFAESFEHFYFNGIDKLDDGEKLDKEVRKDDPKEERKCPQCGHIPFVKRCASCGFERVSLSLVEHLPGEMREITIGKRKAAESPEHLWAQIATFSRSHGKPETASARAYYLYRDIMGTSPPRHFDMSVPAVEVSAAVIGKIRSRQIAHAKGMQKGAKSA